MFASMPNSSLYHSRFKRWNTRKSVNYSEEYPLGRVLTTQKSTLLTLVWVQLPIWKCAISCHLICLPFDSSVISSHVHLCHMLMLVSPMLNITFIKQMLRTHPPNTKPFQGTQGLYSRIPTISSGLCVFRSNIWKKQEKKKHQIFIKCTLPLHVIQLFNHPLNLEGLEL